MPYCTADDLLVKDVLLPHGTTLEEWVDRAAEEIDTFLGERYVIPLTPKPSEPGISAQDARVLKQVNLKLASGRFYLAHASNEEDDRLHAYGRSLVAEAINSLNALRDGTLELSSVDLLPASVEDESKRIPGVITHDKESLLNPWEQTVMRLGL